MAIPEKVEKLVTDYGNTCAAASAGSRDILAARAALVQAIEGAIAHKPLLHPTGSEQFSAALAALGRPAPWELFDDEEGVVLAADKSEVLTVSEPDLPFQDQETQLAMWIICAVNTLAGFKAVKP